MFSGDPDYSRTFGPAGGGNSSLTCQTEKPPSAINQNVRANLFIFTYQLLIQVLNRLFPQQM